MQKKYYVYILASQRNGTLYIGVTNNLQRRGFEHSSGTVAGFTKQYQIHYLVYFEEYTEIKDAIRREKAMKKWNREWKLKLIEKNNPKWLDLFSAWTGFPPARE